MLQLCEIFTVLMGRLGLCKNSWTDSDLVRPLLFLRMHCYNIQDIPWNDKDFLYSRLQRFLWFNDSCPALRFYQMSYFRTLPSIETSVEINPMSWYNLWKERTYCVIFTLINCIFTVNLILIILINHIICIGKQILLLKQCYHIRKRVCERQRGASHYHPLIMSTWGACIFEII